MLKSAILESLRKFINQRPGLEFGNYGDWSAYRAELRTITRDRSDAFDLMTAVASQDSITAEDILSACQSAYSGRLSITDKDGVAHIDYCTGQYWPTEYRRAVCAVLAQALWHYTAANMPAPSGKIRSAISGIEHDSIEGLRPGDWLRKHFRREFGRGLASRWFN